MLRAFIEIPAVSLTKDQPVCDELWERPCAGGRTSAAVALSLVHSPSIYLQIRLKQNELNHKRAPAKAGDEEEADKNISQVACMCVRASERAIIECRENAIRPRVCLCGARLYY